MWWFFTPDERAKVLNLAQEQIKMTREEAVALAKKLGNGKPWYESDIDLLEALGLIKFDEPKISIPVWNGRAYTPIIREDVICALKQAGYKVVKI